MSLGLIEAGIDVVAAYEFWDVAVDTYNLNFPGKAHKQDLGDIKTSVELISANQPDIIVGGPPCQDFSGAGLRDEGTRASLTKAYAEIIAQVKPRAFVMENVPNALNSKAYETAKTVWIKAGYSITEMVVDATYFRVPQHRKRLVVMGFRDIDCNIKNELELEETILPRTLTGPEYDTFPDFYYRHPRSYTRRAVFARTEPAPTIRGTNRPRPATYMAHVNDKSKGKSIQALTTAQRAAVQTFPEDFKWSTKSKTLAEQMIGNAVPVEMAHSIGSALVRVLEPKPGYEAKPSFEQWLQDTHRYTTESAKDVLSRLRRAFIACSIFDENTANTETTAKQIDESPSIAQAAKTEMKRAMKLWGEYAHKSEEPNNI